MISTSDQNGVSPLPSIIAQSLLDDRLSAIAAGCITPLIHSFKTPVCCVVRVPPDVLDSHEIYNLSLVERVMSMPENLDDLFFVQINPQHPRGIRVSASRLRGHSVVRRLTKFYSLMGSSGFADTLAVMSYTASPDPKETNK